MHRNRYKWLTASMALGLFSCTLASFQDALCAADGPPPLFALILAGNFRTFSDPRVFESIRANLIDALGAPCVVFIWGKVSTGYVAPNLRHENKKNHHNHSKIMRAVEHLSARGGPEVVLRIVNESVQSSLVNINPRCQWVDRIIKDWKTYELAYAGQLHSNAAGYEMMESFEQRRGIRFDWVARVRLDAAWLNSVRPWCTLRKGTAYLCWPQPPDWFFVVPRDVSSMVFKKPHQNYISCKTANDMLKWQANCCGGGPTAQVVGGIMAARVPVVGPEYTGSKWGNAPVGSYPVPHLWPVVLLRNGDDNKTVQTFGCGAFMLPPSQEHAGTWGNTQGGIFGAGKARHWRLFYDRESCERMMVPNAVRYHINGAQPLSDHARTINHQIHKSNIVDYDEEYGRL